MALDKFEKMILQQLKFITGRKLKEKDLLEWSSSESVVRANARDGEVVIHVEGLGIWACLTGGD